MNSMSPSSISSLSSLLTPSESHAFQSFLSSINDPPSHEWNIDIDVPKDKQALAKATKDLMALDNQYSGHYAGAGFPMLPTALPPSHLSLLLPHRPNSDSSSRTPTPTSASPFPAPPPPTGRQSSRPRPAHPQPYPISPAPRQHRSYSQPQPRASSSSLPAPSPIKQSQSQQKPALLSASQKKANHIQSEQKRRANIRRGYEALCECVPALREAIREEEEATSAAANEGSGRGSSTSGKNRKSKTLKGKDGDEKIDGRAGPRSENVVLSKTIDYINDLLDERSALLARLHRARSSLPPGHPALIPLCTSYPRNPNTGSVHERGGGGEEDGPLWEREWKGGHGTLGNLADGDEDGDESS
ncbi:hypothetical protein Hypma_006774 [Hypsizygus marmoreus]|uniref:BHLH domain-containing protein n=1 Tax=Hypsizygus marmoreus TaxID=39966 RepID=A0A369K636_HYPMA|nr:hypothetical protein Hypma_006774 [Hypsizygus marmoreus]